jgi:hypothetical protein
MPAYARMLQVLGTLRDSVGKPMESTRLEQMTQESRLTRGAVEDALTNSRGRVIEVG